jgi:cysteine desulfurase
MRANNETGVLQDIATIAPEVRAAGAVMHTDAAQALGKIPLNFKALGVDAMTLSAHKAQGPKGVAALIVRREVEWAPLLEGGGHEGGRYKDEQVIIKETKKK